MVFLTNLDIENLPKFYRTVFDECMTKINATEDLNDKLQHYDEFAETYTMIPRMWIHVFEYVIFLSQCSPDSDSSITIPESIP